MSYYRQVLQLAGCRCRKYWQRFITMFLTLNLRANVLLTRQLHCLWYNYDITLPQRKTRPSWGNNTYQSQERQFGGRQRNHPLPTTLHPQVLCSDISFLNIACEICSLNIIRLGKKLWQAVNDFFLIVFLLVTSWWQSKFFLKKTQRDYGKGWCLSGDV